MSKLGSRVASLVVSLVLAMASAAGASGSATAPIGGDPVYAASNGSQYHRADCPRLHIGEPLSREEARKRLSPCPVCKPDDAMAPDLSRRVVSAPAAVVAEVGKDSSVNVGRPVVPTIAKPSRPKSARGKGPTIGAVVGGLIGGIGAFAVGVAATGFGGDSDYFPAEVFFIGAAGAAAGAFAGYAIGGGYRHTDEALREEQDRFRLAHRHLPVETLASSRPQVDGARACFGD